MFTAALVFAGLAAILHIYIFVLESVSWTADSTRRSFGTTMEQATATKEMAFNQGFYNLFLAIIAIIGIFVSAAGHHGVAVALVLSSTGSMLAAGLVLLASSPAKAKSALMQLAFPLVTVVLVVVSLIA